MDVRWLWQNPTRRSCAQFDGSRNSLLCGTMSPFFFYPLRPPLEAALTKDTELCGEKLVSLIGMDQATYGSHSCRKGGCTMAVEAGVPMRLVSKHGRWRSSAVLWYVKDSLDTELSVTR